jgi:tRNA pseudouridine38-40 synthase
MLAVQYDGTDYAGWQRQAEQRTVQEELEDALTRVLGREVRVTAASRTDAGVHALGQVVALETEVPIPVENLVRALNDHLPPAVSILEGGEVPAAFHPRFSASGKLYSYRILNRPEGSPFLTRYAWHVPAPALDVARMQAAAERLTGKHDFSAFRSAGSCVRTSVRRLYRFELERHGALIEASLEADGFLYQMVRNLMGAVVEAGAGKREPEEMTVLLESRDRTQVGPPAPPQGLCLVRVFY